MTGAGAKRVLDIAGAATGLVLSAPLMLGGAVAVLLEDGRPVLFSQRRVGLGGREFTIYKLRTMVRDASSMGSGLAVDHHDPRILRSGDLLRKAAIDELPQLWNVLRGDMSLVGPRPTVAEQVAHYTSRQRRRLEMKPGLTGWPQVHGRASLPWSERIEMDVWYVDHWSLALDLRVLWMTVLQLVRPHQAYRGESGGFDL